MKISFTSWNTRLNFLFLFFRNRQLAVFIFHEPPAYIFSQFLLEITFLLRLISVFQRNYLPIRWLLKLQAFSYGARLN